MKLTTHRLLLASGVGTVAIFLAMSACSSDTDEQPSSAPLAPKCAAGPAEFPPSDCSSTVAGGCKATQRPAVCPISDAKCGDPKTCLPFGSNTGKSALDFRIRRLNLVAPQALTTGVIQHGVVNPAVEMNLPQCGESGTAKSGGLLNWLFRLDNATGTVQVGGAPPSGNILEEGFCFARSTIVGQQLQMRSAPFTRTATGFTSAPLGDPLVIPVFLNANDLSRVVFLPIRDLSFHDVRISADQNCIGRFNENALADGLCHDEPATCSKWETGGALGGYITLKEADDVRIVLTNQSLCSLLTAQKDQTNGRCPPQALTMGDYCSTTRSPGGCRDSFWVAATFAASAVTINDGATTPTCSGATILADAGPDASDAGPDASDDGDAGLPPTDASTDVADARDD